MEETNYVSESDLINLLNDINFERIDLELKESNFFEILKISRMEIRHSNFLGWLLDPNESHGLNELILVRFLRGVFSHEIAHNLNALDADKIDFRSVEIKREWQNIDLLIITDKKVICIENKVDSKEHSNQLTRYKEFIQETFPDKEKTFVYLTPYGNTPKTEVDVYIPYSYVSFAEILERILNVYEKTLNDKILTYINDYHTVLKRQIMQTDTVNDLAVQLYKTHRKTLDFILENRPDVELEIRELLQQKVKDSGWILGTINKGYVRFLTPELDKLLPKYEYNNGWANKESFLFELEFYWTKDKINLKTTIAPGEEEVRTKLTETLKVLEGSVKPWGSKWVSHFLINKKFNLERLGEMDNEERMKEIDKFWPELTALVDKVNTAITASYKVENTK
ncbi:MAG: hypothetical protein ACJAQR_000995 [Bacteroidia bacterium]|jgi:hypothetical protein